MTSDKITVNGALISTDVDSLIRTISEKKKVGLNELERICNMDRRSIDKWIRVLEDEGYISIAYGLTGTKVLWLGDDDSEPEYRKNTRKEEIDEVLSNMPTDSRGYYGDPERRLEEYLKKRRESEFPEEDLKANILERLDDDKTPQPVSDLPEEESPDEPPEDEEKTDFESADPLENPLAEDEPLQEVEEPSVEEADEETSLEETEPGELKPEIEHPEPEAPEPEPPPRISGDSKGRQVKELVNAYINQISKEKKEIEKLKGEKEKLYRERYLALESKVEADIASITERILERQGRILELKERVLELPDKVGEVEKVHGSVKKLETDGRDVLRKTKSDVEQFIEDIARSKEEIQGQISESREMLGNENGKVEELKSLSESVESKVQTVKETVDSTKADIEELNEKMQGLLNDLEEATEMKIEIGDMVNKVGGSIAEKEAQLNELESQLESIDKVEQWVREYVTDYERKIDEITEFVQGSDEDISALRQSAETTYIQKYLRELDSMTASYESAMEGASSQERDIDDKIADAKRRLSSLVKDSKDMIRKLRTEAPDFETGRQEVAAKSGRMLQLLEEKEAERGKLIEDFQGARRGRPRNDPAASRTQNRKPKTRKRKRGRPPKKGKKTKRASGKKRK